MYIKVQVMGFNDKRRNDIYVDNMEHKSLMDVDCYRIG